MSFTLSTSIAGPVALNPGINPLYITTSGTVTSTGTADGIDGAAGPTIWTISNQGAVTAAGGIGVALGNAGIVGNSGTISGTTAILSNGGNITNNQGGTLSGLGTSGTGGAGVYIVSASGSVTNAGNISAPGTGGAAVDLGAGGNLTNEATGTLTGNGFGAFVTGSAGAVTNSGSIAGADGVTLAKGGNVNNGTGGRITGVNIGVYTEFGSLGSVTNNGSITASGTAGTGVDLGGGGSVANNAGGTISGGTASGGNGIFASGGPASIANGGSISGFHGVGLAAGGSVTNDSGGSISGQSAGVQITGSAGAVFNGGQIGATGTGGAAVDLEAGGVVTNNAGASLSGASFGVFVTGSGGTVTNAGTISGATYAVDFAASGTNRLIVDPGAVFTSKAFANASGTNTLELASGTSSITGIGSGTFTNFQTLAVDAGGTWTLTGTNAASNVLDSGTLVLAGAFTGLIQLQAQSTLEVAAPATTSTQIDFVGESRLIVDNPSTFGTNVGTPSYTGPQIQNFANGDQIDLKTFSSSGVTFNFNATTGLLQVANGASQAASLDFQTSSLAGTNFRATSDGSGGTLITNGPGINAGLSDVFWRNSIDNTLAHWTLNGAQIASNQQVTLGGNPATPDASWNVVGIGDFNGDQNADLLWRNANGSVIDWTMNGAQIASIQNVTLGGAPATPDASWNVAGIGDFNGDGKSDILWQNTNGSLIDWTMNGSQITAAQNVTLGGTPVTPDASWRIAGIGDFNGDGKSDILWRNANGSLLDWTMNGSQIAADQSITLNGSPVAPDASWKVVGIGDFNGDGKSDILWQNANGSLIDWTMNGSQIAASQAVTLGGNPVSPDSSWQIAQIADFNGDGKSDLLWRNSSGSLEEWTMNGAQITASQGVTLQGSPATPPSNWASLSKPTDFV
ncbi:MAG: VCBS repeat-containing protein [Hyphomicrobiales bacterium]|nr:VCBS repeat-containing protein [Hyphomicrobiales bacterium]